MKPRLELALAFLGLIVGLIGAFVYGLHASPQAPAFNPAANPFARGIYAEGIIESSQSNGANINIYPNVSGTIVEIQVHEGQQVSKGTVLIRLDDSVQRATAEQLGSQAEAARAMLEELKAEPRIETFDVSKAQLVYAQAQLKNAQDELTKQETSYRLDPKSVSKYTLDDAINAAKVAAANLKVVQKQYELTKAGAWIYDIRNQEKTYEADEKAYMAAKSLLAWYTLTAPADGKILAIQTAVGSYVGAQGTYDTYTQGFDPVIVMGTPQDYLNVRCYIDEILIHRLKASDQTEAEMSIRGTNISVPLQFVRIQPYVSPKIELSDERLERVDVRVLPVIFRFKRSKNLPVYPGQLVDVYVAEQ
ncbi:MAG TPA: biotin/lipoyl-binding protein [Candidatus Binataceae bacterium]|nr:biotin/lipoyl-binding protein [Candidatus Binataceae bacterium]